MARIDRKYVGTVLSIAVGFAIDLTVGLLGDVEWWYLTGIALLTVLIAFLLWPRYEPPPSAPTSAVFDGEMVNSVVAGSIDTDADTVHRGRGDGNWWLGKIKQRRPR